MGKVLDPLTGGGGTENELNEKDGGGGHITNRTYVSSYEFPRSGFEFDTLLLVKRSEKNKRRDP